MYSINSNVIGSEGGLAIAMALKNEHNKVRHLNVKDNCIAFPGVNAICSALVHPNNKIVYLKYVFNFDM